MPPPTNTIVLFRNRGKGLPYGPRKNSFDPTSSLRSCSVNKPTVRTITDRSAAENSAKGFSPTPGNMMKKNLPASDPGR